MEMRRLGRTDLELSVVGLGTWAIGGPGWKFGWGPQSDAESIATIHRALDLGVNWIDTAPLYGLGHAEEIVGKALVGVRDRPFIATKCGRFGDRDGHVWSRITAASIRDEVDASLRRLNVDVIDLYQIHWPRPDEDIEEAWETVAELATIGKIRHAGVSNFDVAQLERIRPIRPVDSLQSPYSMIERGVEESILEYCGMHHIGFLAYSPMQKGLLTGRFAKRRLESLPTDDHRRDDRHFQSPRFEANLRLVDAIHQTLARASQRTLAQIATGWVLRRPEVTAAIVGARSPTQITETANRLNLSEAELRTAEELLADHAHRSTHTTVP